MLRDEADFIECSLARFASQFDKVLVYDTGSLDNTWDIVTTVATRHQNIVPISTCPVRFSDKIRGYVWEHAKGWLRPGDWFARVDADEIYHVSPRKFIEEIAGPERASQVYMQYYNFMPTHEELANIKNKNYDVDYENELRHYVISSHVGEPRLFRYRGWMQWESHLNGPQDPGPVASRKIPVRHYQARNPIQLQKRVALRQLMYQFNSKTLDCQAGHWNNYDWRNYLGVVGEPSLKYWATGSEFEVVWRTDHLDDRTSFKSQINNILHKTRLVTIKDLLRHKSNPLGDKIPIPLLPSEVKQIEQAFEAIDAEAGGNQTRQREDGSIKSQEQSPPKNTGF